MATICKSVHIHAAPQDVWDALRDVGALHTRLARGFVVDTRLDGDTRIVTFGNGMVVSEDIVTVDDATHRVVWAITGQQFQHYNGAAQVHTNGGDGTDFVWTVDLLPDEMAAGVEEMMEAGMAAIKTTLEQPEHQ
jgi:carbon monoxide dehydrogenase subunit G